MVTKGIGMKPDELDKLLEEIDNCPSPVALKKLGARLTHELQEARDIAFMALSAIKKLIGVVKEMKLSRWPEISEINAELQEGMQQRWNMTNSEINKIADMEPREDWEGEEKVH